MKRQVPVAHAHYACTLVPRISRDKAESLINEVRAIWFAMSSGCSHLGLVVRMTGSTDGMEWNDHPPGSAFAVLLYFHTAVHFQQPLPHSGQAASGFRACLAKSLQALDRYAAPRIPNFENQLVGQAPKTNAYFFGSGVAMHIGQAFL